MREKCSLLAWLPGTVALILVILHFTRVIVTPATEIPNPEISSKRFDRIGLFNLSAGPDIEKATFHLYQRDKPDIVWRTYELAVPGGGMNGRVLNLVSEDPVEDIVRVTCSFTFENKEYIAEILAEEAVLPDADPNAPALNAATFWFGPDGPEIRPDGEDPGPFANRLCGEGVLGDHTTWVDYRN